MSPSELARLWRMRACYISALNLPKTDEYLLHKLAPYRIRTPFDVCGRVTSFLSIYYTKWLCTPHNGSIQNYDAFLTHVGAVHYCPPFTTDSDYLLHKMAQYRIGTPFDVCGRVTSWSAAFWTWRCENGTARSCGRLVCVAMWVAVCVAAHVHMYIFVCKYICICITIYIRVCVYTHVHMHIFLYVSE